MPPGDGGVFNLPALVVVLLAMAFLLGGAKESARADTVMVCVKIAGPGAVLRHRLHGFQVRQLRALHAGEHAVVVLRRTRPDMSRTFRVPLSPLLPAPGFGFCVWTMGQPLGRHLGGLRCLDGRRARVLLRVRLPPVPSCST